jgi:hypothetical protein
MVIHKFLFILAWNCESGDWFGWEDLKFKGTEVVGLNHQTVRFTN